MFRDAADRRWRISRSCGSGRRRAPAAPRRARRGRLRLRRVAPRFRRTTTASSSLLPLTWTIVQGWRAAGLAALLRRELASPADVRAIVFFAALAVHRRRAADRVPRHRRQPRRSSSIAPSRPAHSRLRCAMLDMLWRDSMGAAGRAPGAVGAVWMLVVAPARAVLLLAFPVPFLAFISQHRSGQPLPQPGAAVRGAVRGLAADVACRRACARGGGCSGRRWSRLRHAGAPRQHPGRPVLPAGRHPDARAGVHRDAHPGGCSVCWSSPTRSR